MKRLNTPTGFSVPELLIVILVLGAIFGVGGYAWSKVSTHSKTTSTKISDVNSSASESQERTLVSDPYGDWAEYKNNDYGFTFRYPQDWGTPSVSRRALNVEKYETNLPYAVKFSNGEAPQALIIPSDWKFTPPNQTEWRFPLIREDLKSYQVIIADDDAKTVAITYSGFSGEAKMAGLRLLDLPRLHATQIEVHKDDTYDSKRPCLDEQKNQAGSIEIRATLNCYPEAYRNNFVKFMDSFKAI